MIFRAAIVNIGEKASFVITVFQCVITNAGAFAERPGCRPSGIAILPGRIPVLRTARA